MEFDVKKEVVARIEKGLPGAKVELLDPRNDGIHLEAHIVYAGFSGKGLVEQHRMVYGALGDLFETGLHALSIKTKVE